MPSWTERPRKRFEWAAGKMVSSIISYILQIVRGRNVSFARREEAIPDRIYRHHRAIRRTRAHRDRAAFHLSPRKPWWRRRRRRFRAGLASATRRGRDDV